MFEIKEFKAAEATVEQWRDYFTVFSSNLRDIYPDDDEMDFDIFMPQWKSMLTGSSIYSKDFIAYFNEKPVAIAFFRKRDDTDRVETMVIILKEFRRKGLGTQLLNILKKEAAKKELKKLLVFSVDLVPAGEFFLSAAGAKLGLVQKGNQLKISELDLNLMKKWVEEGKNAGFESGTWENQLPEEYLEEFVKAYNSINDAPHGTIESLNTNVTVETMKNTLETYQKAGTNYIVSWVRNTKTGEFALISDLYIRRTKPFAAMQYFTVTVPKYRGNGFGKLVKALNALFLVENRPRIRFIRTSNAEVNEAMLAINEKMGFKHYQTHSFWELDVDK